LKFPQLTLPKVNELIPITKALKLIGYEFKKKTYMTRKATYMCDHCCVTFYEKGTLLRHIQVHLTASEKCTLCSFRIKHRRCLNRHMLTMHQIEKPKKPLKKTEYLCEICNASFENSRALIFHRNAHIVKCSFCPKEMRKDSISKHVRVSVLY